MKGINTITSFKTRLDQNIFHFLKTNFRFIFEFVFGSILFILLIFIFVHYHLPAYISVTVIVILLIYLFFSLYNLIRSHLINKLELDLRQSKIHNQVLERLNDDVRCFRHDFSNILIAIGGYIQSENLSGLKEYYSSLMEDCLEMNNDSTLSPDLVNNPAIYAIIASKYHLAKEKGINVSLNIFFNFNNLKISVYEFTRILGILMDNAIEAAKECEEKIINVSITNDQKASRQILIIENTYQDKNVDTEKIYEKGFSSKPHNTGLGLWEVRKILNKHSNLNLYTSKDDKYFRQQLEIY